jgi:hypothetical protein
MQMVFKKVVLVKKNIDYENRARATKGLPVKKELILQKTLKYTINFN